MTADREMEDIDSPTVEEEVMGSPDSELQQEDEISSGQIPTAAEPEDSQPEKEITGVAIVLEKAVQSGDKFTLQGKLGAIRCSIPFEVTKVSGLEIRAKRSDVLA